MTELTNARLLNDSILNQVVLVAPIDAVEAIKNGGTTRFSVVAFQTSNVPSTQRATLQGGPGMWSVAHWDNWLNGAMRR